MLFAAKLPMLLLWLTCVHGNDVNSDQPTADTTFASTTARPLPSRSQTKVTRDDQLLTLLATRRRQIIQSRFKNHLRTIVDLSTSKPNVTHKNETAKNATTIHVHLNLSELLHNTVHNATQDGSNVPNAPSTESNLVNGSTSKDDSKRKNARPNPPQSKENKTRANMPIIRNILYRRKMSFLNRKLPIDLDQISFDTLGLSEINKNDEDLLDSEDSLQVEESSHDKLIYYDTKNNSSKKSLNNFEDVSEEMRNVAFKNKTKQNDKNSGGKTKNEQTNTTPSTKDISLILNNTLTPQIQTEAPLNVSATTQKPKGKLNNTLDEQITPILNFGDKIIKSKKNESIPNISEDKTKEATNVSVAKPIYENKVTKSLSIAKVGTGREFIKNKQPNSYGQNYSALHTTPPDKKNGVNIRTFSRHRGFRNRTIFVHNKRNGQRHTINLTPNKTIASLKPLSDNVTVTALTNATENTPILNSTKSEITVNISHPKDTQKTHLENNGATARDEQEANEEGLDLSNVKIGLRIGDPTNIKTQNVTPKVEDSEQLEITTLRNQLKNNITDQNNTVGTLTTSSVPTTRIVSTNVVTSVSIKSSKQNNTDLPPPGAQAMDEIDPRVVATLSNFTSQTFHNGRKNDANTRNPATMYPNITLNSSTVKPYEDVTRTRTKFILRPKNRTGTMNHSTERVEITSATAITVTEKDKQPTQKSVEKEVVIMMQERVSTEASRNSSSSTEKMEFNPNLGQQNVNAELPIATLFSITDFKKDETKNTTTRNIKISGVETIISRKNEDEDIENLNAAYILAALGFLPMSLIVIYVVKNLINRKNKQFEDFETELHDSDKKSIITPVARLPSLVLDSSIKWEFPRSKLRLQTLLGQGNFGQVWKAEADDLKGHIGLTRLVAVKTIKDGAGSKERDDLLRELAIMQKMGSHPNVVTLLGCCTDKEPYLVIMEYVMYGKLLTFLRDHRTRRNYYNFSDDAATLTARDLTVFAYCVARGMEYLVTKGIIHRDLAARNILVDHNKLCKIADFGMSRDSPTGEVTEPRQPRNALPVRWMAIESLLYSMFTHKTDVWSFGVLLWEIVTLGSSPYANMSGREVMRLVCAGYRLERPNHCRPELYEVMARTWDAEPARRPSFAELRTELAAMLDNTTAEGSYVDLESFRADSTVYEIDNCTPRGNYFTVKSRYSEFECEI